MSGLEIVGLILSIVPVVQAVLKGFKSVKDRHSNRKGRAEDLDFDFNIERVIYYDFIQGVLRPSLSQAELHILLGLTTASRSADRNEHLAMESIEARVRERLGDPKAHLIVEALNRMRDLLENLRNDLLQVNNGAEAFTRMKSVLWSRESTSLTQIQRKLNQVNKINAQLKNLLSGNFERPSQLTSSGSTSQPSTFLHRDRRDAREIHDALQIAYPCESEVPHSASLGCHCSLCQTPFASNHIVQADESEFELVFVTNMLRCSPVPSPTASQDDSETSSEQSRSISVSVHRTADGLGTTIQNMCAMVREVTRASDVDLGILKGRRSYKLAVVQQSDTDFLRLYDLVGDGNSSLSLMKRSRIAYQLCSLVLQLWKTPWIGDTWTWTKLCALRVAVKGNDNYPEMDTLQENFRVFVEKDFYSANSGLVQANESSVLRLLVGSVTLVNLGLALVILALGKSMKAMREEMPDHFRKVRDDILDLSDSNIQDYVTARHLLRTGLIKEAVGSHYEAAIKACFGEYYEDSQGQARFLDTYEVEDGRFFENAEERIMRPLYRHCQLFN
ncbi:hypothetical protein BX600DRAFT_431430 [Xylariales sp. PMI_506]|nr:hypothetical protein BX600DRAFT_431430 [Xylariales sp. PMI_506]